jgi:hypothetical protein
MSSCRGYVEPVATWEDVRRIATALPGVTERDRSTLDWRVADKGLAWERPLRKSDLAALNIDCQEEPVLGVRTADEGDKFALIEQDPDVFFTIPHFNGYSAVLIWLDRISAEALAEVVTEAWLARAPRRLVREYLARGTSPAS